MAALPDPTPAPDVALFERVIVPLDGSVRAERVLQLVTPLVRWLGSELTLLHVHVPRPERPGARDEISYPDTLHDRVMSLAGDYLAEVSSSLVQSQVRVKTVIAAGRTAEMILAHAERGSSSMIAISASPRSKLRRLFRESVTEDVWAATKVPVLVFNASRLGKTVDPPRLPRTVLVPVDGTRRSEAALYYARHIALAGSLEVTLLGVARGWSGPRGRPLNETNSHPDPRSCVETQAEELRGQGLEVSTLLRDKPAAPAIEEVRRDLPPHVVVMAAPRRTGWKLLDFRGAANELIRGSADPIILVPPNCRPERDTDRDS